MMTQEAIAALKRNIKEIFEAEGFVRIVCDTHVYYMDDGQIESYRFDCYGISLVGRIRCVYQASCVFNRVYIPFETITTITGKDI